VKEEVLPVLEIFLPALAGEPGRSHQHIKSTT